MSSSSAKASTPAYPPPMKTKVSARARRSGSVVRPRRRASTAPGCAGDRLADGLETHRPLGEAGDRRGPGDRTGGHDQHVVAQLERLALDRDQPRDPVGVVDGGDLGGEHPALAEHLAQRDHDVPALDRAGRGLWQERLVGHRGVRVDHGDDRLVPAQPPLQPVGRVHPHVTPADDEDVRSVRHLRSPSAGGSAGPASCPAGRPCPGQPVRRLKPVSPLRPGAPQRGTPA